MRIFWNKIRAQFLEWNTLHDYESFLDFQNELLQQLRLEELCNGDVVP